MLIYIWMNEISYEKWFIWFHMMIVLLSENTIIRTILSSY